MENSELGEREKKVFQTGLFDNLSVQDAVTIIVLYAAQLNTKDCQEEISRIRILLGSDTLFSEKHSETLDRINKFQNSMSKVTPMHAIEKAAEVLTPDLQQKAFMLAAHIGRVAQKIRTKKILEKLASKLSIQKEYVQQLIVSAPKTD